MKAFYFILGHYVERNLQYGLVHTDLTPRPAYVAFAAVGRLLNAAEPIGRVDLGDEKLKGFVFRTVVDGAAGETLVVWSEMKPTTVKFPSAEETYDYLGRKMTNARKVELTRAPIFLLLPRGGSKALTVVTPPEKAKWVDGKPCPVVLQLLGNGDLKQSAFQLDETNELKLVVYNFGDKLVRGQLSIQGAATATREIGLMPGATAEQKIKVVGADKVMVKFDVGDAGHAIVTANVLKAQLKN